MTIASALYSRALSLGLRLEADGDTLVVTPKSKVPAEFVRELKENKAELLAFLAAPPCPGFGAIPPLDLPLNRCRPNPSPEDRERMIAFMLRQTGSQRCPLLRWLVTREAQYFNGPGRHWDCALHAYAAARDAATWQLQKQEAEAWQILEGFEETMRNQE